MQSTSVALKMQCELRNVVQTRSFFIGTLVALAGLVFFVLTLPGSRYGFLDAAPNSAIDLKTDFWATIIQLLPRLLMLVFIQVAQYLSYTLRKKIDDKKALLKFADELLKEQEFGRLSRGQTTAMIEAQKAELNEFSSLYERLATLVTRSQGKTKREAKSSTDAHQL